MTGNWRDRFEPQRDIGGSAMGAPPPMSAQRPPDAELDDDGPALDIAHYRPWTLQRGRSRPVMMLDMKRYDERSGFWTGWAVSYPHLIALQYTGDRLLSLDFGARQFIIEGDGLGELARHLQQGAVLTIHEYASSIWPTFNKDSCVRMIRQITAGDA
jgi:hypothetical protein